ncbi:NTP transferase domain-containing protein [Oscillospiraceae bacterium CM]|nr:NTP transferase domain-containing protein [Oscillospiraceae bacterium CM]
MKQPLKAVVLAAGKGTRLQTEGCDLPKVMRLANGRPLLQYVLDGLSFIEHGNIIIVAGYQKDTVIQAFPGYRFAIQTDQLGTGHAVMSAAADLEGFDGAVLVCCGDMPLLRRETYEALVTVHLQNGNDCTILTGTSDIPLPYGRIVRDNGGNFVRMVEDKDCRDDEKAINELNSGVYVFAAQKLLPALKCLGNNNAQREYYLTDVPAILLAEGARVGICKRSLGFEMIGVNTAEQLNQVEKLLRSRE